MNGGLAPVGDAVLDEQLAYYRARAPEYDDWFERRGRFDRGPETTAAWRAECAQVRASLASLDLLGRDVLELAPGTGIWTELLLALGATVTAVDAAPEMLEQLRRRIPGGPVRTVRADLFCWRPLRTYDAVVSCFFMSHVPDERFDDFLDVVASSIEVGGSFFLLDSARSELSTAANHQLPSEDQQTMTRLLEDGCAFTIVKRFRSDGELASACERHGLAVRVERTPAFFQVALGVRV